MTEYSCRQNFHCYVIQISGNIMCLNTCFLQNFKEFDGCFQVCFTNAFNLQTNRVFAGVKYAVFACAVILELQQHIAVFQFVNVFCLALINLFHYCFRPF